MKQLDIYFLVIEGFKSQYLCNKDGTKIVWKWIRTSGPIIWFNNLCVCKSIVKRLLKIIPELVHFMLNTFLKYHPLFNINILALYFLLNIVIHLSWKLHGIFINFISLRVWSATKGKKLRGKSSFQANSGQDWSLHK